MFLLKIQIITTKQCSQEIFVAEDCLTSNTTHTLCIKVYEQDCGSCINGDDNTFMPMNNIELWGDWGPTSRLNGDAELFQHLDCSGNFNNIQIKAFSCNNPNCDLKKGCNCNCDICQIYGHPHFETFDSKHHYQGQCAYYYVKHFVFFIIYYQYCFGFIYQSTKYIFYILLHVF